MADFCNELPGRRAGVAQLLLNDVDDALDEVRRVKAAGLFGGVMIPNIAPDSHLPPLHAPVYEPLWALCEELELPVNMHGGTGVPNLGPYPATPALMFLEFGWYAQRPLLRLLFSGVFERHPELTFIMTEQGNSWVPGLLAGLDWAVERMLGVPGSVEETIRRRDRARACRSSRASTGRGSATSAPASWDRTTARYARPPASIASCGGATTRTARERIRTPVRRCATPSPASTPTRCNSCSAPTRRSAYGFDLDALSRARRSDRSAVADVAEPLGADEFPADALSPALDRMKKPVGNIS